MAPSSTIGLSKAQHESLNGIDKATLESQIHQKDLVPLWNTGAPPTAPEPHTKHVPAIWRYEDTKRLLRTAVDIVSAEEAERRAVLMINPGGKSSPHTTDALLAAHQLIIPGERALCHRHTPFAVRFLIEGDQGYTAIDGKKMYMLPGDLIITPQWKWHDHGNEGTKDVIWLDGLNIPLFKLYPIDFTDHYIDSHETQYHDSRPVLDEDCQDMKFPWVVMQKRLDDIPGEYVSQEYRLPGGSSVSRTVGAYAERLSQDATSHVRKDTVSRVFQVHAGRGSTEVTSPDGKSSYTLTWGPGDAFTIPAWHEFVNRADSGGPKVYLFYFSDQPLQTNLGLYRSKY